MTITRLNPDTLHKNPVFTQVATVDSPAKLVFVGGQNGVDVKGQVVGKDIASQSAQAYKNVGAALEAAGATFEDVIKMNVYIVQGNALDKAFGAFQQVQAQNTPPSTISLLVVVGLANPEFLIEIEAVAAVSTGKD